MARPELRYYRVIYNLAHSGDVSITSYFMDCVQTTRLILASNDIVKVTGIATVDQAVAVLQKLDKVRQHLRGLLFP